MGSIAFEETKHPSRNRVRFATSLWLWVWVVGLLISRIFREPQNPSATEKRAEGVSDRFKSGPVKTQAKSERAILSLALDLVAAISIKLTQRYFKSWTSTLIGTIENTHKAQAAAEGVSDAVSKHPSRPSYAASGKSPEELESKKHYEKGIIALFKNTATEWVQDKCPQLGAALAYFTVFSLAPLVLVLLAVFGLIFGGSDQG